MSRNTKWIATIACAGIAVASLFVVAVVDKAPARPLVLHSVTRPIFFGPHENSVTALAFSPDGTMLATGAQDGLLRIWDAQSGRLKSLHGDDAVRGIDGIAISPDGRAVAVVGGLLGRDGVIWDLASDRIAQEFDQPAGAVDAATSPNTPPMIYEGRTIVFQVIHAVAFSPDGSVVATGGDDVILRDVQSGKVTTNLPCRGQEVTALAFFADGKTLATAGNDKQVRLWSIPDGELKETLDGATQPLTSIGISSDGTRIAATGSGKSSWLDSASMGALWVWDRPDGPVRQIEMGSVDVRQVAFVAPEMVVLAAGRDLLSIDLQGNQAAPPRKLRSFGRDVLSVAASPDGRLVACGGADRIVDIVQLETGALVHRLPGFTDRISAVATSADGAHFATASIDFRISGRLPGEPPTFAARYERDFSASASQLQPSQVRIWSARDGRLNALLPLPACQVTAIDFVPDSSLLAVAGWTPEKGGMLSLWDVNRQTLKREFGVGAAEVLSIAVSSDGSMLASGGADGSADLWDAQTGAKIRSHAHDQPVEAVAISADGKILATGDADRTVRLFDASNGAIVRTINGRSRLKSLDFSPDGKFLAAGTCVPGIELWDLRPGGPSRTLKAPGDDEYEEIRQGFVAFSPDSRFVVFGGRGKNIAVFDLATGTQHCELEGHFHPAAAAAFLPDGRLVSGGEERTIRLWNPDLGKLLATWIAMPADDQQNWADEWLGFNSERFMGSTPLNRLAGWRSARHANGGPENAGRHNRVDSLFQAESTGARPKD